MEPVMQDKTRDKPPPQAHEDKYLNDPPVHRLPKTGDKRGEKPSSKDPTAGRVDERRNPGKESREES
jgi:hypothetical protein